jgi:hypothetical protein
MIERIYPGVYLAEVEFAARPIDGVPTTPPDAAPDAPPAPGPAWTEPNAHDPGVGLLQLFGFMAESLLYRADATGRGTLDGLAVQSSTEGTALHVAPGFAVDSMGRPVEHDLSPVTSQYIGETEKNLGTLFGDAASGRALLRYDDSDALFGKCDD